VTDDGIRGGSASVLLSFYKYLHCTCGPIREYRTAHGAREWRSVNVAQFLVCDGNRSKR
jgi:hypothetical protein